MGTIHTRLKELREELGLSQADIAKALNIGSRTYIRYENGEREIPSKVIAAIARLGDVDLNWFIQGNKTTERKCDTVEHTYEIIRLDLQASAGHGIEAFETAGTPVILDKALFRHPVQPQHLRIIPVVGDSMEPTIPDGSHIVIDTSRRDTVDGIYVIRFDDRIMVKRLQFRLDGTTEILSDNPHYQPQLYDPSQTQQELQIIGRKILTIQ